ncbi:MAG: FkbM family methyltransferase [archaeon]
MGIKTDFSFLKAQAKDKQTLNHLTQIEKDWHTIREKGIQIKDNKKFILKLRNIKIQTSRKFASSSLDTYLEMYKLKAHMKHPLFNGKNDSIVVDLGANEGFYIIAMKENNPNLRIVGAEALPINFSILNKNIALNKLKNIEIIKSAVTNKNGKIYFEYYPGVSAIAATDIAMQKRIWVKNKIIKKITVPSITLSTLCKKKKINFIDILKLDVEGSEYDILTSSEEVLKKTKKVVIEWHSQELKTKCKKFMQKLGFDLVLEEKEIENSCGEIYLINKKLNV